MSSDEIEIVRFALAFHLERDPASIDCAQRLEDDLGLDPLDLVLVVLRLEELGEIEFPIADLEGLKTVGDLVALVERWVRDEAIAEVERSPRAHESGFHPIVNAHLPLRRAARG